MLQKRRDLGSIPDGLGVTAAEMNKGTAVIRKFVGGVLTFAKPSSAAEAKDIYGFITLRIDDDLHTDKYHDVIPAGVKAVVYTLVANNEWATTEYTGTLAVGDKCVVEYSGANAGKLKKATSETPLFEVVAVSPAMAGYNDPMVTVRVLPVPQADPAGVGA